MTRRPEADPATRSWWTPALSVTLAATLALAPNEGYLLAVNGSLGKVAPALFLVTWASHRVWTRRALFTAHPIVAGVAALTVIVLVSTAVNLPGPLTLLFASRWLPFLVLTVALVDVLTHDVDPWLALWSLLTGAVVAGGGALFSFVVLNDPRATGPLTDPNDLAYVLAAAVPIALVLLGAARTRRVVLAGTVALAVLMAGAATTVSRGGAVALTLVLVWVVARRIVPLRLLAAGAVLVVLLGGAVALIARGEVETALDQKRYIAATNIETRSLRWQAALRGIAYNPLLGSGPGGAATRYVEYSNRAEIVETQPVVHQMYLEVGAELGVPGLFVFLFLIGAAGVCTELTVRNRLAERAPPDDPLRLAALAVQGSLIAICTASMFLSEEFYMPLWAAIATGAALELRSRRSLGVPPGRRPHRPVMTDRPAPAAVGR